QVAGHGGGVDVRDDHAVAADGATVVVDRERLPVAVDVDDGEGRAVAGQIGEGADDLATPSVDYDEAVADGREEVEADIQRGTAQVDDPVHLEHGRRGIVLCDVNVQDARSAERDVVGHAERALEEGGGARGSGADGAALHQDVGHRAGAAED